MATVSTIMSTSVVNGVNVTTGNNHSVGSVPNSREQSNGTAVAPHPQKSKSTEYQHLGAVHSRVQSSVLSHDSEQTPSFLGFRNLMVIVLSKWASKHHAGQ